MGLLKPITQLEFEKSIKKYEYSEKTDFFEHAQKLVNEGFEIEGIVLLLATWNFANFRYHMKTFDSERLNKVLTELYPRFQKLKNQNIVSIDFKIFGNDIKVIYTSLQNIPGVGTTGASKIMQLKNPELFVMWDSYIRGKSPKSLYKRLRVLSNISMPQYKTSSKDYVQFLKDMQHYFKHLTPPSAKPMAKSIDEYNFSKITLPLQKKEKFIKKEQTYLKGLSKEDLDL
jgi:hypothetical protein